MARIALPSSAFAQQPTSKSSRREHDEKYLDWIRSLPCIVTGREAQAAHVSYAEPAYGKLGRGLGAKESDRWTVPLCQDEHARQHQMNERAYWQSVGIDPCIIAMALFSAFPNAEKALLIIRNVERRAI